MPVSVLPTPSIPPALGNYSKAVAANLVWRNVLGALHDARMTSADLVKTTAYITRAEDLPRHRAIRDHHIGEARPAGTLVVVQRLGPPAALIEVEAVAFASM